jgi:hypothetical protein
MTGCPLKPAAELEGALQRGDLPYAVTLAAEVAEDQGRPIDFAAALRFLPLVTSREPEHYDAWARHWLLRWIDETAASIEAIAEVAAQLADLCGEPAMLEENRRWCPRRCAQRSSRAVLHGFSD